MLFWRVYAVVLYWDMFFLLPPVENDVFWALCAIDGNTVTNVMLLFLVCWPLLLLSVWVLWHLVVDNNERHAIQEGVCVFPPRGNTHCAPNSTRAKLSLFLMTSALSPYPRMWSRLRDFQSIKRSKQATIQALMAPWAGCCTTVFLKMGFFGGLQKVRWAFLVLLVLLRTIVT